MNDRAIQLSEKSHVELVLYARGVELERDRLLELIRVAHERLAPIAATTEVSSQRHEAIQQVADMLAKYLSGERLRNLVNETLASSRPERTRHTADSGDSSGQGEPPCR